MRNRFSVLVLLMLPVFCYGQGVSLKMSKPRKASVYKGTDPYKGKPFKPGDIKTLHLTIPMGKLTISNDITYRLISDKDGRAYRPDHTYRAYITKVTPTEKDSTAIPKALTEGFKYRVIDLTEKQIMSDQLTTTRMDYFFAVDDFNLDGRADFAFIGDKHYHPYPLKNYVWVDIKGKLVYWYGLSDVASDKENKSTRMLSVIVTAKSGNFIPKYYNVVRDTTLVPVKHM